MKDVFLVAFERPPLVDSWPPKKVAQPSRLRVELRETDGRIAWMRQRPHKHGWSDAWGGSVSLKALQDFAINMMGLDPFTAEEVRIVTMCVERSLAEVA